MPWPLFHQRLAHTLEQVATHLTAAKAAMRAAGDAAAEIKSIKSINLPLFHQRLAHTLEQVATHLTAAKAAMRAAVDAAAAAAAAEAEAEAATAAAREQVGRVGSGNGPLECHLRTIKTTEPRSQKCYIGRMSSWDSWTTWLGFLGRAGGFCLSGLGVGERQSVAITWAARG
jgi:hypothetical protein